MVVLVPITMNMSTEIPLGPSALQASSVKFQILLPPLPSSLLWYFSADIIRRSTPYDNDNDNDNNNNNNDEYQCVLGEQ